MIPRDVLIPFISGLGLVRRWPLIRVPAGSLNPFHIRAWLGSEPAKRPNDCLCVLIPFISGLGLVPTTIKDSSCYLRLNPFHIRAWLGSQLAHQSFRDGRS